MKAMLILNGEKDFKLPKSEGYDFVVCADGAYEKASRELKRIDYVVGDFDSLGYQPKDVEILEFEKEKDFTDGEIAMNLILEKGIKEIDIFWGMGLRVDHFLGNLALLKRAKNANAKARMISKREIIVLEEGKIAINVKIGTTISLLPFSSTLHIISSSGLKYQTDDLTLTHGEARGVSNEAIDEKIEINADFGDYLVIINKEGD